ncbi:MAG TPA: ABC transporter substrate-binding protein [Jiangellaceae bacterium]
MKVAKWQQGVLVAATGALVLAACGGGEEVDVDGEPEGVETDGTDGADEPADGETGGTLVAGIAGEPDQLDPHITTAYASFQVLENVYDTLVVPDVNGEFQPGLATEWEVSDDQLTWTFTLREGVTFHDGSEFTADDVAYTYNRIIDDETSVAWRFASVENIEATADDTVVLTLSEPAPNLLDNIGGYKGMSILPEGAAEDLDLATEAVGTGPFELEDFSAGGVMLTASDSYWGEAPTLDGVEYRFISEPTAALTALRNGEIHWTDNVAPQDIASLEGADDVMLGRVPSVDYWYLALNQNTEPWSNRDARRGIAFALDREAIAEAAQFGAATVNQTAIPADSFWASDYAPYENDPEQARSLLDSGGVEEGQELGIMVVTDTAGVPAAEVMVSQLGEVGISASVESEETATWLDRQGQGDFDAYMWSWIGNLDPFGFYHAQHVCEGGFNFQGYCNEDVDALLNEAAAESDQDARKELYDQAAEMIVDDASYIYLYNPDVVQAWVPGLDGYEIRPDSAINFENVTLP